MSWQRASVVSQSNNFLCDISSLPSNAALSFFLFRLEHATLPFVSIFHNFERRVSGLRSNENLNLISFNFLIDERDEIKVENLTRAEGFELYIHENMVE